MLAIISGNAAAAKILLNHQAKVNTTNKSGMNVLHILIYRHIAYSSVMAKDEAAMEIMELLFDRDVDLGAVDNDGTNLLHYIVPKVLNSLLKKLEAADYVPGSTLDKVFEDSQYSKLASFVLDHAEDHLYELAVKKIKGESVNNFRKDDDSIYIGIVSAVGYYSEDPFKMAIGMMDKHKDVKVRMIAGDMINDEFIQQFDGLVIPGGEDSFPKEKEEFGLGDLNPDDMLYLEKVYQSVIELADKYGIPTVGMCAGHQHIILHHKGMLMPIDGYNGDNPESIGENNHRGTFVKGSVPYFLALTPGEQRNALTNCTLPSVSLNIKTNHHYVGIVEKLGKNLKVGVLSEGGVVQSVYNGARFISFQFHPEDFYFDNFTPNRNRLIWENFLEICRQHRRYHNYASEHNLDLRSVMNKRDLQNEKIFARLEECAKEGVSLEEEIAEHGIGVCIWLYQVHDKNSVNFQELIKHMISENEKEHNEEDVAFLKDCAQKESLLEKLYRSDSSVESFPKRKDRCDREKFQWSDYK